MSTGNTTTGNRFSGILDRSRATEEVEEQEQPKQNGKAKVKPKGKPPGKSSDPEYMQISAYVRKETHKDAKKLLLDDEQGRDLSDVIEELLSQWVRTNT